MPNSFSITATLMAMRQVQPAQTDVQVQNVITEASVLDPETRSRLLQLGHLTRSVRNTAATMITLTHELKADGLGTLGPPQAEVLSDEAAFEELKRNKQRESELSSALRYALGTSQRVQADMLRAFSFLLPKIVLEDEEAAGLPGFQSPMKNPADLDMSGLIWNSHADFFAQISALLEVLKTEWLSKYQDALAKFLEFYKEFSDIMEKIKFDANGDKGDVTTDFSVVRKELKALMAKYGLPDEALASFSNEAAARTFKDSMGLPGLTVVRAADGSYKVMMDLSAVDQLINDMPAHPLNENWPFRITWDSARYNSWISAKDSNMEQIKHVSKVLGEKLNEMTQKFDNIVKILSSSIDKMSEANNAYVHNT